jgi:hypothetical protein
MKIICELQDKVAQLWISNKSQIAALRRNNAESVLMGPATSVDPKRQRAIKHSVSAANTRERE